MTIASKKELSAFAESALILDDEFQQFERLSAELDRLPIDTDHGLERARLLLGRFGECSQKIGDGVQSLARELEASRARAEKAAETVSIRASQVQKRQQEVDEMVQKFQSLGEMVKKITEAVAQLQKPAKGELSDEEKRLLVQHLPELNSQLDVLIGEAKKLKEDAHSSNMKSLEKNADSLAQSLQSVRSRLNMVGGRFTDGPSPSGPQLH